MGQQDPLVPGRPGLCIVNYNGGAYLPTTLAKVMQNRDEFSQIVFVDDASTDDSVEVARSLLPDARVVVLPRNRGPGVARNKGLESLGSDRVLFMDNDVELQAPAVRTLMRALDEHAGAVIAMPRIVSADAPDHIEYEGGEAHFSGLVRLRGAGGAVGVPAEGAVPVSSLISCCFLFDRTRWHDGPLFDESFQMYLEDHELGLRATMLGHDLLAVPAAVGLHGRGTPEISVRATGRYTERRIYGTILHRWRLMLKLYQTPTLVLLSPYLVVFEALQLVGALALGWGRVWLSAFTTLLASWRVISGSRSAFKQVRRRPDRVVLTGGPHPFNPALEQKAVVRLARRALDAFAAANWAIASRLMPRRAAG